EGSEIEWLQSLVGAQGDKGEKGDKGDRGDTGPGLRVLGIKDSVLDLPETAEALGDAYLIDGNSWVYGEAGWFDAGVFRGEKGEQGDVGPKGDKGDTGTGLVLSGEVASSSELPSAETIAVGVAYAIGSDVWVRGEKGWFNAGQLRGPEGRQGPAGPRGERGIQGPQGPTGPRGQQG